MTSGSEIRIGAQLNRKEMTIRSTRSKAVKEIVIESVKEIAPVADVSEPNIKKLKKSVIVKPAVLPLKIQNSIIRNVLDRLDGKSVILHGIDRTKSDLLSNLKCAVSDYRGNSSILIGPRSSGKTILIKQLIAGIKEENTSSHFIDSLILQGSIFSETQSVLKYLLGKFKGIVNGTSVEIIDESLEDLSEYLAFDQLTALVKQYFNAKLSKKRFLIFVLEDLEKFAAHPQQNLLYCLFELALSLPVFVIGTSCRIDVLELFEKRVKSRFSQNIVYLPLSDSLEDFVERIKVNLTVSGNENIMIFNKKIEEFIQSNQNFNNLCKFNFDFTKDVRPVFRVLTLVFASINQSESFDWNTFPQVFDGIIGPVRQEIILNTSVLETTLVELMIIVSMCRLAAKYPSAPVTFDAMTEELSVCKLRAPGLEHFVWTKSTLQVAFDRLISCRLLIQANNTVASSSNTTWIDRSYITVRLGLPIFVILDAIERHGVGSKEIFALACEKF